MASKKRTRDSYESEEIESTSVGYNNNNNNNNHIKPQVLDKIKMKNVRQDTEAISERTINILMNSQKSNSNNNNNKINSNTVRDVEFTNLNPNIPSDYFNCSSCTQGSCRNCDSNKRQLRECPSCYHKMCGYCAHYCEGCNDIVCSSCCVTNTSSSSFKNCDCCCNYCGNSYDQTYNIDYCIDCNYNHK